MFKVGDFAQIKGSNSRGQIIKVNSDGTIKLIIKGKNIYIASDKLESVEKLEANDVYVQYRKRNKTVNTYIQSSAESELMIRHQIVSEAMQNVDKFIDNAICHKLHKVKIIHGKGGGILREEVHKYLSINPNVSSYELGDHYERAIWRNNRIFKSLIEKEVVH